MEGKIIQSWLAEQCMITRFWLAEYSISTFSWVLKKIWTEFSNTAIASKL